MAFFGKDKEPTPVSSSSASSPQDQINLIGQGTVFEGTFQTEGDVRASGRVNGHLKVKGKAIVAESGVIEGEMEAGSASIAGTVSGEVTIKELLVLKGTARVDGNIKTGRLVVEEGALFSGECTMENGRTTTGESVSGTSGSASSKNSSSGKTKASGSSSSGSAKGKK